MLTRKQKRVIILLTGKQNGGYVMNEKILDLLIRYFENQKMLEKIYKNESSNILNDYSISEMHCVDYIGKIDKPNVTKLSALLNVTRGGVSKIIKKLMKKGAVESFTSETNKKEIYYSLTSVGEEIFNAHARMHERWYCKDVEYLEKCDSKKLETVAEFLDKYNKYLEQKIDLQKGDV